MSIDEPSAAEPRWQTLRRPPALAPLYLRAALHRGLPGGRLPDLGLRCPVIVEPANLAGYRQLCGFADTGHLPPTYPHVLAFALQMRLLTADRFPFPLPGLVHLENRLRVLRPLGGLGPFELFVECKDLEPHEKGAVFSLISRLEDQLGPLWEGESRLLCRGARVDGDPTRPPAPAEPALTERARWTAAEDTSRAYARVSGDYNPIHLSAPSARLFGFPRAIAHGLWTKARTLAALAERLPATGFEVEVHFQKPVPLPSELVLSTAEADGGGHFAVQGVDGLPHLRGRWQRL
jgi:acyl dehydratase